MGLHHLTWEALQTGQLEAGLLRVLAARSGPRHAPNSAEAAASLCQVRVARECLVGNQTPGARRAGQLLQVPKAGRPLRARARRPPAAQAQAARERPMRRRRPHRCLSVS